MATRGECVSTNSKGLYCGVGEGGLFSSLHRIDHDISENLQSEVQQDPPLAARFAA